MKIGFCNGCFDRFHKGHEYFLRQCIDACDHLIVAVNDDAYCTRVKGPDRPRNDLEWRMGAIANFLEPGGNGYAVIPFIGNEDPLIMAIRPDVIFKGFDHSPTQTHYAARTPGWKNGPHGIWKAPIVHIGQLPGFSTTMLAEGR